MIYLWGHCEICYITYIQALDCLKQGINAICAKFNIVPKIIKGFHFLKGARMIYLCHKATYNVVIDTVYNQNKIFVAAILKKSVITLKQNCFGDSEP